MPYERPAYEDMQSKFESLLARFKDASTAEECFSIYKEYDDYYAEYITVVKLARIRHSLDTTDEFYSKEKEYWDMTAPKLQEVAQKFTTALLNSPFRKDMESAWGHLMFTNAEMELKTFEPEIIADLQEESALQAEYTMLTASAQIDFDGKKLSLAEMYPYYEDPDRAIRKGAKDAAAKWSMSKSEQMESIFDQLVKVRTTIAKKLGYENFVQLGYYRMQRNCYDQDMVAEFRKGVIKHIVPVVVEIKKAKAKRIGVDTIRVYDQYFDYPEGNAKPEGTAEEIFANGKKMYHELSSETAEFIDFMLDNELFDVKIRPGKAYDCYCSTLPKYKSPFIFANFNGTSFDIAALTHEAGHAFASYMANDIYPSDLKYYSLEIAEIHSIAMEFFTWPWMKEFFGEDAHKYCYSHLSNVVSDLPLATMIDEFQHHIYQNPKPRKRYQSPALKR